MQNNSSKFKIKFLGFFFGLGIAILFFGVPFQISLATGTTDLRIEILPLCGNNIKETGEQCDGSDLGGASCASQGYTGGTLSCNSNCTSFNTFACTSTFDWNFDLKKPFWSSWYRSNFVVEYDENPEAGIGVKSDKALTWLEGPSVYFWSFPTLVVLAIEIVILPGLVVTGFLFWFRQKYKK